MQVKLHLVKGNPKGKQVEVPPGTMTVGRAEDSDLIIASTRVSRHHCEIINSEDRLVIRDKGSGNGTLVNGKKTQEQVLTAGDEIQVGPLTFAIEINGVRKQAAKPAAPVSKPRVPPKPAAAAPPKPKPVVPGGKPSPADILSSLERMAGPKAKPGAPKTPKKKDDVLEISEEDLLDPDH